MKSAQKATLLLIPCLATMLAPTPAHATSFSFTASLTSGSTTGTVDGLLTLPCLSGSCAASSLVLTSVPAAFGSFAEGLTVTNWTDQVQNTFTITGGAITSFLFIADDSTPGGEDVCFNSTGTSYSNNDSSGYGCPAGLNIVETQNSNFGYNFSGLSGITFTPASSTPEPGTLATGLGGALVLGLTLMKRLRLPSEPR